jgi:predicted RNA-binding protein YlqC (UPF0109 family)
MKAFVEYVVKALVDFPDEVTVTEVESERAIIFELRMNQKDVGKVIGKSGRTINAIRSLLTSAAAKHGKRVMVEIIEPSPRAREEVTGRESQGAAEPSSPPPSEPSGQAGTSA